MWATQRPTGRPRVGPVDIPTVTLHQAQTQWKSMPAKPVASMTPAPGDRASSGQRWQEAVHRIHKGPVPVPKVQLSGSTSARTHSAGGHNQLTAPQVQPLQQALLQQRTIQRAASAQAQDGTGAFSPAARFSSSEPEGIVAGHGRGAASRRPDSAGRPDVQAFEPPPRGEPDRERTEDKQQEKHHKASSSKPSQAAPRDNPPAVRTGSSHQSPLSSACATRPSSLQTRSASRGRQGSALGHCSSTSAAAAAASSSSAAASQTEGESQFATRAALAGSDAGSRHTMPDGIGKTQDPGLVPPPTSSGRPIEECAYLKKTNEYLREVKRKREAEVKFLEAKVQNLEHVKKQYQELYEQSQRSNVERSKSSCVVEISNLHDQLNAMIVLKDFLEHENMELRRKLEVSTRVDVDDGKTSLGMSVCVVCMDNLVNLVCLPCKHLALCSYCGQCSSLTECPICRATIVERLQVYTP